MATPPMLRAVAEGLKICGVSQDGMLAILCLLTTPEQEQAMLNHLLSMENPETEGQLLGKAVELSRDRTAYAPACFRGQYSRTKEDSHE